MYTFEIKFGSEKCLYEELYPFELATFVNRFHKILFRCPKSWFHEMCTWEQIGFCEFHTETQFAKISQNKVKQDVQYQKLSKRNWTISKARHLISAFSLILTRLTRLTILYYHWGAASAAVVMLKWNWK